MALSKSFVAVDDIQLFDDIHKFLDKENTNVFLMCETKIRTKILITINRIKRVDIKI